MRINENNYVDKAEEAIIELVKDAKERYGVRYRDKLVTTSKIRNLLAMTADIYNQVLVCQEEVLSDDICGRIEYLRVRFMYEYGRDDSKERKVKNFIDKTNILVLLKEVGKTKHILVKTGMHIGGSGAFAAIGAVDSPIIRDARTNLPMIPGSSLKGKMRSLLAKEFNERVVEPNEDHERITRLFGSSKKGNIKRSRLLFSDMVLKNEEELRDAGLQSMTEVKFENSISRATAVANPRQIERAVRGSVFKLDLIYELEEEQEFLEDMETLAEAMKLLQYDYLGGNGSRGYGKIQFQDIYTDAVVGHVDNTLLEKCNSILNEAVKE